MSFETKPAPSSQSIWISPFVLYLFRELSICYSAGTSFLSRGEVLMSVMSCNRFKSLFSAEELREVGGLIDLVPIGTDFTSEKSVDLESMEEAFEYVRFGTTPDLVVFGE